MHQVTRKLTVLSLFQSRKSAGISGGQVVSATTVSWDLWWEWVHTRITDRVAALSHLISLRAPAAQLLLLEWLDQLRRAGLRGRIFLCSVFGNRHNRNETLNGHGNKHEKNQENRHDKKSTETKMNMDMEEKGLRKYTWKPKQMGMDMNMGKRITPVKSNKAGLSSGTNSLT